MNDHSWTKNPALTTIDPAKLQMLTSLADQAKGKNQKELLSFLMSASAQTKENHMSFDQSEIDAVIRVMKEGKSPEEIQRIDRLIGLIRQFRHYEDVYKSQVYGPYFPRASSPSRYLHVGRHKSGRPYRNDTA